MPADLATCRLNVHSEELEGRTHAEALVGVTAARLRFVAAGSQACNLGTSGEVRVGCRIPDPTQASWRESGDGPPPPARAVGRAWLNAPVSKTDAVRNRQGFESSTARQLTCPIR